MNVQNTVFEQMKKIADLAPCGIGVFDLETELPVFLNAAYYKLIGYTEEECRQTMVDQDAPMFRRDAVIFHQGEKDDHGVDCEYRIVRKDGNICWVKLDVSTMNVEGKAYACTSFTDITREKEAYAQLSMIAESTNSSVSMIRVSQGKEQLVYANERFFQLIGVDCAQYQETMHLFDQMFVSENERTHMKQVIQEAIESGQPGEVEHPLRRPDGELRWMNRRYRVIAQDEPDTYMFVSVVTDITEKKEAQRKAELEQQRFRLVVDEMNAAVFEWNTQEGRFYSSAAYQKYAISQVNADDILYNRAPTDLVHTDDLSKLQQFFRETVSGNDRADVTLRLKMTDGSYRWCKMIGFFKTDENHKPLRTIGVIIDINEEHERNFMMDNLLNELPGGIGIFTFAETLKCSYYTDGFAKMAGLTREEMDQKIRDNTVLSSLIAPSDFPEIGPILAERTAKGLPLNLTYRYLYRDGSVHWLHLSADKLREEDGYPVYYCIFTNPTNETALYRSIVEDAAIGVFVADRATRSVLYMNHAADHICGFPRAVQTTGHSIVEFLEQNGKSPVLSWKDVRSLRMDAYSEFHVTRNGMYLAIKAKALMWNGVDSYILYITDETVEHDNQVQLQKLVDEVPSGIGIYDVDDGRVNLTYLNNAYYEMIGVDREERQRYYGENALDAVYPEDRTALLAMIKRLVAGENRGDALHRICNHNGEWIWLNIAASVIERTAHHMHVYAAISNCDEMIRAQKKMEENHIKEQILMTSIPGGTAIYRIKKDGRVEVEYISEGFARVMGYANADEIMPIVRNNALVEIPEEDGKIILKSVLDSLERHIPISVIYRLYGKNRRILMVRMDANVISSVQAEDDIAILYAVHTLVSEESQLALREQHRYRGLMGALDMVLLEWERDRGFYASEKYDEYAISDQDYRKVLSNCADVSAVHPDDVPALHAFFGVRGQKKSRTSTSLRMKMKDGSYRWTEMLGFYEYDEGGNLSRVIGIFRDIDKERIEQNERLKKALKEAQKASLAKSSFLSRMSHDMRTPLNGMLGLAGLMRDAITDEKVLLDLSQMELSGQYLLNLINDTLDVSRIESGNMELHPSVCGGHSIFENVIALAKPLVNSKNIHVDVQTKGLHFPMLYIDIGRVEQIMMNILGNAVKFTPEGGRIQCIMTNISEENGVIVDEVCIRDNGIGMSKEFLPHLFEPFSQEDSSKKNSRQGTGLGMIITKQLVELMGGTISVESELGKGTSVTFTLVMPIATEEQIAAWRVSQTSVSESISLTGKHILLCEDHPLNAKIAIRLLRKKGMIVQHAENGEIGRDMFGVSPEGYFDAILMDIRMPVMDGLEATEEIRNMERADAHSIPIIALTANAFAEDIRETQHAGMDAHVSKPIEPQKLYEVLANTLKVGHTLYRPKILIVDDYEINRVTIKVNLLANYDVLEAENGKQALDILHRYRDIEAVITDIQMPEMDGIQLIQHIRSNPDYKHLVVIANTQFGDRKQEQNLIDIGADEFIYKPTSPEIVKIRVRNALKKYR